MDIKVIFDKPSQFMTSIEDRSILMEGQEEFQSSYNTNPALFDVKDTRCSKELFDELVPLANTSDAPVFIPTGSPAVAGRVNVYIENGYLKKMTA